MKTIDDNLQAAITIAILTALICAYLATIAL